MKIEESYICGKHTEADCEDGMVITPWFAAVIDGSTSKTPRRLDPTMKNGRLAMLIISQHIKTMPASTTMEQFCEGVTRRIANEYERHGVAERMGAHPEERLTASAIIYSVQRREVWMVGDCQAIVDNTFFDNAKPYEQHIATIRANMIKEGMAPADARRAIEPQLVEAMLQGQNTSYAVIDGTPIYMAGTRTVAVSHAAVLTSDGYPFLHPTLKESEEALARQLADDPQNISSFVATKGLVEGNNSFDDRAYIRLTV